MKVYLWEHKDGIFLVDEDFTRISKPYFITHPQRTNLLKDKLKPGTSNNESLKMISDEELQEMVSKSVIRWKEMIQFKLIYLKEERYGFTENYIAQAEI